MAQQLTLRSASNISSARISTPSEIVAPPPRRSEEPPELVPYFTEQELEVARQDGHEAGFAEGRAASLEAHEAAVGQALAAIAIAVTDGQAAAEVVAEQAAEGVARLLLRSLSTMLPALCAQHGPIEVAAVMRCILPKLKAEPRIVIQVHPDAVDGTRTRLADFAPDLVERIALTGTSSIDEGDVRIGWQDGEAVRDGASLWREIADVLGPLGLLDAQGATQGMTMADQRVTRESADVE